VRLTAEKLSELKAARPLTSIGPDGRRWTRPACVINWGFGEEDAGALDARAFAAFNRAATTTG
jgi:hypothetical protein